MCNHKYKQALTYELMVYILVLLYMNSNQLIMLLCLAIVPYEKVQTKQRQDQCIAHH